MLAKISGLGGVTGTLGIFSIKQIQYVVVDAFFLKLEGLSGFGVSEISGGFLMFFGGLSS